MYMYIKKIGNFKIKFENFKIKDGNFMIEVGKLILMVEDGKFIFIFR